MLSHNSNFYWTITLSILLLLMLLWQYDIVLYLAITTVNLLATRLYQQLKL